MVSVNTWARQICTAVTGATFDIDGGQQLDWW
jgi:hypothetical protein